MSFNFQCQGKDIHRHRHMAVNAECQLTSIRVRRVAIYVRRCVPISGFVKSRTRPTNIRFSSMRWGWNFPCAYTCHAHYLLRLLSFFFASHNSSNDNDNNGTRGAHKFQRRKRVQLSIPVGSFVRRPITPAVCHVAENRYVSSLALSVSAEIRELRFRRKTWAWIGVLSNIRFRKTSATLQSTETHFQHLINRIFRGIGHFARLKRWHLLNVEDWSTDINGQCMNKCVADLEHLYLELGE